jgi:hypothetical protein
VVGKKWKRVEKKLYAWVMGIQWGIRRVKTAEGGQKGKVYSLWVPRDGRVGGLLRAVCMDLSSPVENPTMESYEGGFL